MKLVLIVVAAYLVFVWSICWIVGQANPCATFEPAQIYMPIDSVTGYVTEGGHTYKCYNGSVLDVSL